MTQELAAFTVVARNYLPYATVLARSFLNHHENSHFYCVVVDDDVYPGRLREVGSDFIGVSRLAEMIDDFWLMATYYDVTELSTAVKPFVLDDLLRRHDVVFYIDPDIFIYAPLNALAEQTLNGGWTLTPHCLAPMPRDGLTPTEAEIMQSGIYNLGYVGVSSAAQPMLRWWQERLRRDAISDPSRQLFTDQRWIDMAAGMFRPVVVEDPGCNVAYWNLDQRSLTIHDDGVRVQGHQLKFFHFSGFDPRRPWWLSKHHPTQPRNLVSSSDALAYLCDNYARLVVAAQQNSGLAASYKWNEIAPGLPLTRGLRRYVRNACLEADKGKCRYPPSPFVEGARVFLEWLREIPDGDWRPRFVSVVLHSRPDVAEHFRSDIEKKDLNHILHWLRTTGASEMPWLTMIQRLIDDSTPALSQPNAVPLRRAGVDVVGYLRSEHGVGEAGRLVSLGLESAGVSVGTVSSSRTQSRQLAEYDVSGDLEHRICLLAVNADQVGIVAQDLGPGALEGRYVIGQWFWELERFPSHLSSAFDVVDEVWVATEFIASAIRQAAPSDVTVEVVPLPLVAPPTDPRLTRPDFGLDDRFMFYFSFDMLSVMGRKNPLGLIEAYVSAFSEDEGTQLVIKCMNGDRDLQQLEQLRWVARDRPDIKIMDEYLSRAAAGSLCALSDCYVSLHRSEGLGLTISEAMALGVPTISTGYSGNTDFVTPESGVLIPASMQPVGTGHSPYDPTAEWASPDLGLAAAAMRDMATHPEEARRIGERGRDHIQKHFSVAVTGARMRDRINTIERKFSDG